MTRAFNACANWRANWRANWGWHGGAALIYAACAILFVDHGESLVTQLSGRGSDPFIFVWDFAWWPWALEHHQNLLHTGLLWAPLGVYTSWITSIPLLAVLMAPVTKLFGPMFSYNVVMIAAPACSAMMAYVLCLKITKNPMAALIGGYLFGFSSYEMAEEIDAINLTFTMFVPALLLVVVMRLRDEMSRLRASVLAALILVGQFLVSVEVFALVFVFGGVAWLLALLYLEALRPKLWRLLADGLAAAPMAGLLLAPFLVSMFTHLHYLNLPVAWPYYFTNDLFNFFLPGENNWLGGGFFVKLSKHFLDDFQEQDGYLGLPLLVILYLFFRGRLKQRDVRFLFAVFVFYALASLGPILWAGGAYTGVGLPWLIFMKLPLLASALPCRFSLFSSLVVAVIAAIWVARQVQAGHGRVAAFLGVLACVVIVPRPHPWMNPPVSTFFQPNRVAQILGPNPRLMIFPTGINGPSSFWQVESGFGFTETGGYLGFTPAAMQAYPAAKKYFNVGMDSGDLSDLKQFCQAMKTEFIIAGPGTPAPMLAALMHMGWTVRAVDDVTIITVPQAVAPVQSQAVE